MDYKPLTIEDKPIIDKYLKAYPLQISELTFTNLFAWQESKGFEYAESDGHLIIRQKNGSFLQPVGPDPAAMMKKLGGRFERVDEDIAMKSGLKYEADPSHFDYVYSVKDMQELAGDRYRAKRNFINRIEQLKPDVCELTPESVQDFLQLNREWCEFRDCHSNEDLHAENIAVRRVLENFDRLDVSGVCVRINDKLVAFAIGEPLNDDTYVDHFEKAGQLNGIYQYLLQAFAKSFPEKYKYLNREQDLGVPGLRKAKESYYPVRMVRKGNVEA